MLNILLSYEIAGNSIISYIISLVIFFFLLSVIIFTRRFLLKKAKILAAKTNTKLDDIIVKKISGISRISYLIFCVYLSLKYLNLSITVNRFLNIIFLFIIFREFSNILLSIIKYILENNIHHRHDGKKDITKINLFFLISKIVVYIIGALIFLSNIGVEITPLIASLGVAGVAVAFSLQKILGDVFSSFSIFLDRPFEIDDFVTIGTDSGHVKDIGLKSTRIETLSGQELIIPNAEVASTRINNYGKMEKRRVLFNIGVVYQTDPIIIEKIPSIIQKIIEEIENTEFNRAHFIEFGKSELNFEIVYYITTGDYMIYRDTHQKICLEIMKTFNKQGISFAYPTQSIYIENNKNNAQIL